MSQRGVLRYLQFLCGPGFPITLPNNGSFARTKLATLKVWLAQIEGLSTSTISFFPVGNTQSMESLTSLQGAAESRRREGEGEREGEGWTLVQGLQGILIPRETIKTTVLQADKILLTSLPTLQNRHRASFLGV
jgi:hypothetical protein